MEQSMWCVIEPENKDIQHHGIRGQRWGVRRYQNKDGSLTPVGRRRYGVGEERRQIGSSSGSGNDDEQTVEGEGTSRYQRTQGRTHTARRSEYRETNGTRDENSRDSDSSNDRDNFWNRESNGTDSSSNRGGSSPNVSRDERGSSILNNNNRNKNKNKDEKDPFSKQTKTILDSGQKIVSNTNKLIDKSIKKSQTKAMRKIDLSDMTDDEIRQAMNRYNLERSYKQLVTQDVGKGKKRLQSMLETGGTALTVAVSAATLAKTVKEVRAMRERR